MKYLKTFEEVDFDDFDDDDIMLGDDIYSELQSTKDYYDIVFDTDAIIDNGFKISIQGKSIEDSNFLYLALYQYFDNNNIPFKVGTQKRINLTTEQKYKMMTIYCPNEIDVNHLAEEIYSLIPDYKGGYNVKTPTGYTHYAGGLFICSDMKDGNYILPNKR